MTAGATATHLRSADLWAGLCVAALGAVGLVAALDIFLPTGLNDALGPRTFPIVISTMLMALGATLTVRSLVRQRTAPPDFGALPTLLVLSVAVAVYLGLFGVLGFMLATVLFLAVVFVYLGERRIWLALVVAVALAVAITVGFTSGLNVALPRGPFGL